MTPAYLEKPSKSTAVSESEAGGGAGDNSMYGKGAPAQWARLRFNQPTQRGPAIREHEWTDEWTGGVYSPAKTASRFWQRRLNNKKLLLARKSDRK